MHSLPPKKGCREYTEHTGKSGIVCALQIHELRNVLAKASKKDNASCGQSKSKELE